MAISLKKGQKVSLTKGLQLSKIRAELGWDTNRSRNAAQFDLDCSVFMLGSAGKVREDSDFIFYNNKQSTDGSIIYGGDNRTGAGDGADEIVTIDIHNIPQTVERIVFTVSIHEYAERRQNFGMVENAYIKIVNDVTDTDLLEYDLDEDFSIESAVIIAEIFRTGSEWDFGAIGNGLDGGLEALCRTFGVDID